MADSNCFDEYFKLKAQLGEPIIELETESPVDKKRVSAPKPIIKQEKLKTMVEQATKNYDFEPVLKMVKADKQRLNERRNQLYQELEDLNVKIAGLDYVEEKLSILKEV